METKRNLIQICLLYVAMSSAVVQAQFTCSTNNNLITITGDTNIPANGVVIIPSTINGLPVISIGSSAFYNRTNLISVTIPNSVTSIGDYAFSYCYGLTNVTNSLSITNIGYGAFCYCWSMTSITISNNVINIEGYAFQGCTNLTSVAIPNSVTNIGIGAFIWCASLTAIQVDTDNPAYSSAAGVLFNKSQTTLIQYPGGKAGSYTISNSVVVVGFGAFANCTSLTNVTIPNSVTNIGDYAFEWCSNLTGAYFLGNVPTYVGSDIFEFDSKAVVYYWPYITGWNTMFSGLPTAGIVPYTCTNNKGAITITGYTGSGGTVAIPSAINSLPVTSIGINAFSSCYSLSSIIIPNSVTSIGDWAFSSDIGLTNVTLPNSITNIGDDAFLSCLSLTGITIPNSVTSIGDSAFQSCSSLITVTVGNGITSIVEYAFIGCNDLTGIYFLGNTPTSVGLNILSQDTNAIVYYLPGTTGWSSTFANQPTMQWKPTMQTVSSEFGVQTNQFGFNIIWASGQTVVVEACTNLASPVWKSIQTNTITSGTSYFNDTHWTNYPTRFYRIRSP